jgi:hypothetical protein
MEGYAAGVAQERIARSAVFLEVLARMLQWKPKLIVLLVVLVLVAALLGQFTWGEQFTW